MTARQQTSEQPRIITANTVAHRRGRTDARGYVYLLQNEAFKEGWVKIGKSRRSGHERAAELNAAAGTGIPKRHRCLFEVETLDCDRAELAVFERLELERQGQQEFFVVDIILAEQVIREECSRVTKEVTREVDEANARRIEELKEKRARSAQLDSTAARPQSVVSTHPARQQSRVASASRAGTEVRRPPAASSAQRKPPGQWITPDQAAAAWTARSAAQAKQRAKAAELQPLAPAPTNATNPHPEFKWIVVLIAVLGVVAMTL
jgi:hypothetical protein